MSQPPQFPADGSADQPPQWGSAPEPSADGYSSAPYGQPSADAYGQQPSANAYGQQPSANAYGQPSANSYGAAPASPYGQASPNGYGQPVGAMGGYNAAGGPMQPPAKKNRWWIWACLGCAVLALLGLLGGCGILLVRGGGGGETDPTTTTTSSASDPTTSDAPTTDTPTTTDPTTSAGPVAGDAGTKDNPFPIGGGPATISTSDGGKADVVLGTPNWDAQAAVEQAHPYSTPPDAGNVYVVVPVTVTYHGTGTLTPWIESSVSFSADNGQVYDTTSAMALAPRPEIEANDITDGGSVEYDVILQVPADQVQKGVFVVEPLFNVNNEQFFFAPA